MHRIKLFSVLGLLALLLSAGLGAVTAQETLLGAARVQSHASLAPYVDIPSSSQPQDSLLGQGSCKASAVSSLAVSTQPISRWQRYKDPDYKFALEYPAEWKVETTIQQVVPFSDPTAIIKRLTFTGSGVLADLDIWLSNSRPLEEWLDWYVTTREKLAVTRPNATVAGQPGVVFVQKGITMDMITTFFGDRQYIYRLWHAVTRDQRGLQAYWHMLDTFSPPQGSAAVAQVPSDVKQMTQQATDNSIIILVDSCCGYVDTGNPFPCCQNRGNCTWWVHYKMEGVPFRGDAGTWWDQVPNYPGWLRGAYPPTDKRSIAWWSGSPGHVAYVDSYNGSGTVTISEMLWCNSCGRTRSINVRDPGGYIYRRFEPQFANTNIPRE